MRLADGNATCPLAGIAGDVDRAAAHAGAGKGSCRAAHRNFACAHLGAEIGAGIAVDDDLTLRKPLPDLVASCVGADEAELGDVSALELERIADGHGLTRRTDGERLDVLRLEPGERGRRQRRQVEPLIGLGSKLERQRTHAMISLRWK